jgi:hypothetical protein
LYINRASVGGLSTATYWSSSESTAYDAWYQSFGGGGQGGGGSKPAAFYVRPVRSF